MSDVRTTLAPNTAASRALYRVVRAIVVGWCRVWFRLTVDGREHLPPSGAYIVAPVHRSYLDTPIVAAVTTRRLRYMGKDAMWRSKVPAWVFSTLGGFPVSRGKADREAIERCIAVLAGGEPLVVFPEGERKSGPTVQPLKDGAAFIAAKAGVPIVPVGIAGSERAMGKGDKIVRPAKVHILIGPAMRFEDSGQRIGRAEMSDMSRRLHDELQRLFDVATQRVR
jgi:1-acyl-sn-glycerol-3-phosphate acyltransferase